ncbi:MAG: hypothetical protein ACI81O_002558 [Cyclobacteriaceae bacterium]
MNHNDPRVVRTLPRALITTLLVWTSGCTVMLDSESEMPSQIDFGTIENVESTSPLVITKYDLIGGYGGLLNSSSKASKDPEIADHLHLDARRYTIRDQEGRVVNFVTDKAFFVEGDCVAVERGETPNLRLLDDGICEGDTHEKSVPTEIEKAAARCALDKRQLMIALTDAQIRDANRRIHSDCQYER